MLSNTIGRACRADERHWREYCVDRNLRDEWLDRLNELESFVLINICEGHANQRPGSVGRRPHLSLRLREQLLPGIARSWEDLRGGLLSEVHRLFQAGDTDLTLDLKFGIRAGQGRLLYREEMLLRMRSFRLRVSDEMDEETERWFGRTVLNLEALDAVVSGWHRRQ